MARPLRIEYPGAWYHAMNRGAQRQAIYADDTDREKFVELLGELGERFGLEVHAWCLMGNHYHVMVRTAEVGLSRAMRHLNGVYTQYFNRRHRRDGPLFRGRYKAVLVEADVYWSHLSRYVHRNPLEAGLINVLSEYRWSSYRAYIGKASKPQWLHTQRVLEQFCDRTTYQRFVEQVAADAVVDAFYNSGRLLPILGSEHYKDGVLSQRAPEPEVPAIKRLCKHPSPEQIVCAVASYYGEPVERLRRPTRGRGARTPARSVAMYVCQQYGGMKLQHIAREFGLSGYASAGAAARNVRMRLMQGDASLQQDLDYILQDLTP